LAAPNGIVQLSSHRPVTACCPSSPALRNTSHLANPQIPLLADVPGPSSLYTEFRCIQMLRRPAAKEANMPWILVTLLTLLALAGILVATVGCAVVLVAPVIIVARRQRGDAVASLESAD
jgi:hypothetical protein